MFLRDNTAKIVEIVLNACQGLINLANFITKNELAYNDFISKTLIEYCNQHNLGLQIINEGHLDEMRILVDIIIEDAEKNKVVCEGKRLLHQRKSDAFQFYSQMNNYLRVVPNTKDFFLLIYSENQNFKQAWSNYKNGFIGDANNAIEFQDITKEYALSNIFIGKTIIGNQNLFHVFLNLLPDNQQNNENTREIISINKILNLSIYNFKLFKDISIDLSPNVNVLLGKNGLGKTSFIQALTLALIPDKNKDVKDFEPFVSIGSQEALLVLSRANEDIINIQISDLEKNTDNSRNIREPFVFAYGTNIFTNYKYPEPKIIRNLSYGTSAEKWFFSESIFKEKSEIYYDPLRLLNNMTEEDNVNSLIDFFVNTLNDLFFDYKIVRQHNLFYYQDINKNLLTTEQLSEGYRSNIILLSDIVLRLLLIRRTFDFYHEDLSFTEIFNKAKGVIAIDEFDRHLHPAWQKVYINNLVKLLPNVQFFLTTHNPVSILGRHDKEVQMFVYDDKQQNINIKPLPNTIDIDAGMMLITHFELDSIVSFDLQTKLDEYYNLKLDKIKTPDILKKIEILKKDLDKTFVGVNIHDYRFYIFIKFLKDNGYDITKRLEEINFTDAEILLLKKEFEDYYSNLIANT